MTKPTLSRSAATPAWRWPAKLSLAAALLILAFGCATKAPPHRQGDLSRYHESGVASWYGKPYHGRKTASGERYDMRKLTAAHKTLPFGVVVKVTNLDNGRSVKVRINDRGPFVKGRIIDLSRAAARQLGILEPGTAPVRITVVKP